MIHFVVESSHKKGMGDLCGMIPVAHELHLKGYSCTFHALGSKKVVGLLNETVIGVVCHASLGSVVAYLASVPSGTVLINRQNTSRHAVQSIQAAGHVVVTIDDTGAGGRIADMRINVMYRTPNSIGGVENIFLREEFRHAHARERDYPRQCRTMLITQGGADTHDITPKIIRALKGIDTGLTVRIIIGLFFTNAKELEQLARDTFPDVEILRNVKDMASLMQETDFAISAGGITMYELACTGTPTLIVCGEPFENESAEEMAALGTVINVGFGGNCPEILIRAEAERLLHSASLRRDLGTAGRRCVDGRGAGRIAELLQEVCRVRQHDR